MVIKNSQTTTGVFLAIAGVLLFSSKAVLVKLAYEYGITALPLLALRMGFSLPIYAVLGWIHRPTQGSIRAKDYVWVIVMGVVGYYLASLFDFLGLQYIKASLERLILFTYPILVLILNRLIFSVSITRGQMLAIGITYMGMIVIFAPEINAVGDGLAVGSLLILGSALTYAFYLVGSGQLIPRFGTRAFTSLAMLISCVCVLSHFLLTDNTDLGQYSWEVYALSFAMAVIATVLPSYMISAAISRLGASNFAVFGSLGPISTILLAYLFLNERLTWGQWLGTAIVIAGVMLVNKKKAQKE